MLKLSSLSSATLLFPVLLVLVALSLNHDSATMVSAFSPSPMNRQPRHNAPSSSQKRYSSDDGGAASSSKPRNAAMIEEHRQEWIARSVNYYSKVMREERRRQLGQSTQSTSEVVAPTPKASVGSTIDDYDRHYKVLAKKHYFALQKIRTGQLSHAELIYQRIINELMEDDCDHAQLAVTTLLLALLTQRMNASPKQTRSVFLKFFRQISLDDEHTHCACSAKVVGAFALFEMKQGNTQKSLQLARKAFELDPTGLRPILNWKQFRDAAKQSTQSP